MIYYTTKTKFSLSLLEDKNCTLYVKLLSYDEWLEAIRALRVCKIKVNELEDNKLKHNDTLFVKDNNEYYIVVISEEEE